MSSKNIKVIVGIIITICIIGGIALAVYFTMNNIKSNETEEKLCQIKAIEFANEFKKHLASTPLNIKSNSITTLFTSDNENPERIVVLEMLSNTNYQGYVAFPICEIETDSNGNLKTIKFPCDNVIGNEVRQIISEYFKTKYDIDIYAKYNSKYKMVAENITYYESAVKYENKDFAKIVAEEFGGSSIEDIAPLTTIVFGINNNK